tara:strand:- start:1269 stop:1514 length:246 start_codon:yes stop_codon:yes gene_type:complete
MNKTIFHEGKVYASITGKHFKVTNRTEKEVWIVKVCEKQGDEISEVMQLPIRRMKDDLHPRYGFEYTLLPKYYITATNIVK